MCVFVRAGEIKLKRLKLKRLFNEVGTNNVGSDCVRIVKEKPPAGILQGVLGLRA